MGALNHSDTRTPLRASRNLFEALAWGVKMQARVLEALKNPFRKHRVAFYREKANVSHSRARVESGVKSSLAAAISRCHLISDDFGEQLHRFS